MFPQIWCIFDTVSDSGADYSKLEIIRGWGGGTVIFKKSIEESVPNVLSKDVSYEFSPSASAILFRDANYLQMGLPAVFSQESGICYITS